MIFSLGETTFETSKSIIVAGIRATGKSCLIEMLQKRVTVEKTVHRRQRRLSAPLIHREVTEKEGIPLDALIHWPIAEKHKIADGLSYENVGAVLLLNKRWPDYCYNVNKRGHTTQYSMIGFAQICEQWETFFRERHLPILLIDSNRIDMVQLIGKLETILCPPISLL